MDLILLQPGDSSLFPTGDNNWSGDASLATWKDKVPGQADLQLGQCLELVSIHHGMKQPVTANPGDAGRASGRAIISEFTCVKYVDKTSVRMYDFCLGAKSLGGKANPTCIHILRNSGDNVANIMTFTLRDAYITEIQFQSHPDDMPTEQFKLSFTEILWTYTAKTADMQATNKLRTGWSLERNRPLTDFT